MKKFTLSILIVSLAVLMFTPSSPATVTFDDITVCIALGFEFLEDTQDRITLGRTEMTAQFDAIAAVIVPFSHPAHAKIVVARGEMTRTFDEISAFVEMVEVVLTSIEQQNDTHECE